MTATSPSGQEYIVGSGIYNMEMERKFAVDLVNEAADLIEKKGEEAFPTLRDITSNFIFSNTYIFVDSEDGVELVNPAFPKNEGQNIMDIKDIRGKFPVREYISIAMTRGSGWSGYMWPKPKTTEPAKKLTYVKKVVKDKKVYIVGCGIYPNQ
jgi:signal transduction histidine kinase